MSSGAFLAEIGSQALSEMEFVKRARCAQRWDCGCSLIAMHFVREVLGLLGRQHTLTINHETYLIRFKALELSQWLNCEFHLGLCLMGWLAFFLGLFPMCTASMFALR
jgi:hypothetical protein